MFFGKQKQSQKPCFEFFDAKLIEIRLSYPKGDLEMGKTIVFHDWLEHSATWKKERSKLLLVFLKLDAKTQEYKTVGEAAVFAYNRDLLKMLTDIVGEN